MVLTREDFMNKLKERIGDDTSDESLKLLEDMTDTFNDLVKKAQGNKKTDEDWEKELKAKDEEWRKKYRDRFFSSDVTSESSKEDELIMPKEEKPTPEETISIDDLFENGGK